jgi:FkbM family methyltransferase
VSTHLKRLLRAGLRLGGLETIRLPGPARDVLVFPRRMLPRVADFLLAPHIMALVRVYGINCVLDVGANRGQYGLELRAAGYRGEIVSFEPVPAVYEQLRAVARADGRWRTHAYALGRTDTTATINVARGSVMSSFLSANQYAQGRFGEQVSVASAIDVPVRRLDAVFEEIVGHVGAPRVLLKMDTQGFDLEVFAGLGERRSEVVALQSEVSVIPIYANMPRMPDAIALYETHGFELTGLFIVSRDEATQRAIEFDCVMARPSARSAGHGRRP